MAVMSNVKEGRGAEDGVQGLLAREGWLYVDKVFSVVPDSHSTAHAAGVSN